MCLRAWPGAVASVLVAVSSVIRWRRDAMLESLALDTESASANSPVVALVLQAAAPLYHGGK